MTKVHECICDFLRRRSGRLAQTKHLSEVRDGSGPVPQTQPDATAYGQQIIGGACPRFNSAPEGRGYLNVPEKECYARGGVPLKGSEGDPAGPGS